MTNFVSFDFHQLNEMHPHTMIRRMIFKSSKLPREILDSICEFLIPNNHTKKIKIYYDHNDHNMCFFMPYYDFSYQFVRIIIFNYLLSRNVELILPNTKQHAKLFKRTQIIYHKERSIRFYETYDWLWLRLFIEVFEDFIEDNIYYCVSWKISDYLNAKYLNILNNYV